MALRDGQRTYTAVETKVAKTFDDLWNELVPQSGEAETVNGELIRAVGRLRHEYYNNGNCNACETHTYTEWEDCPDCNGSGKIEGYGDEEEIYGCDCCYGLGAIEEEYDDEPTLNSYYESMLDFIDNFSTFNTHKVRRLIKEDPDNFSKTNEAIYTEMEEAIVEFVLNNEDKPNPQYKG